MKKTMITTVLLLLMGSFVSTNANINASSTAAYSTDCYALANGYYRFLHEESNTHRRAQRRARAFLSACTTGIQEPTHSGLPCGSNTFEYFVVMYTLIFTHPNRG